MSNARKLADLLDSAGDVKSAHLDNVPASDNASSLTTGTIPIARIADDAITNAKMADDAIDSAQIASGAVDNAHLATGISSSKLTGALPAIDGSSLTGIEGVPSGVIAMWSGTAGAIPSGWVICDGNNSTPNLTDKFIKSAATAGGTGGSSTTGAHTLSTSEMPSHTHRETGLEVSNPGGTTRLQKIGNNNVNEWAYTDSTGGGGSHTHTFEPVYFALIYIMKT